MKPKNTFNFLLRCLPRCKAIRGLSFCIFFLLLAFTTGDSKSEYILPLRASSVCATDFDLDGDNEIVVGHQYSTLSSWGGLSILTNDGQGYLQLADSFYFEYGFPVVNTDKFDNNDFPDIFSRHITTNPYTVYAGVVYNYAETQFDSIKSFFINYDEMVDYITSGDVNGDGYKDIAFACNTDKFWGVLYNDGTGNFSQPEYYFVDYYPTDLHCGDLNNDGRDDIVLASAQVEIYYSSDTGFLYNPIGDGEDQVALADFDLDNNLDIVGNAGFGTTSITFYENIGNEEFIIHELPSFQPNLGNLNIADFNNDSLTDVALESGVNLYVLYNHENFTLSEPSIFALGGYIHHFSFADFDGKGYQDIAYTISSNAYIPNLKIMFNDGNGNFGEDPITDFEIPNSLNHNSTITCFPNPFKSTTQFSFNLMEKSSVAITIYDHTGKIVNVINPGLLSPGNHSVEFNSTNLSAGIYFYSLEVNGVKTDTKKMTLMR